MTYVDLYTYLYDAIERRDTGSLERELVQYTEDGERKQTPESYVGDQLTTGV